MESKEVERAFRNSRAVTLGDSKLYLIIEANHINETVMLDEVYQDGICVRKWYWERWWLDLSTQLSHQLRLP